MGKSKRPKPIPVKDPQRARQVRRAIMHTLGAVVFVGLLGVGFYHLRSYVEREVVFPQRPPKVVLKNRPAWMSDALAIQIINTVKPAGTHSAFDRQLLQDTAMILRNNPWIRQVKQVRRAYGQRPGDTLEIDCEYRAPIALVHWKDYYWLVDGEAVKLPEQYTAQQLPGIVVGPNRRLNIRVIEGVSHPPVESGQVWPGEDLAAGLDLVKLLYGQVYADEIVKVDVTNFAGRIDPKEAQITLVTKYDTQIRWGRPINAKDFFVEVSTPQKLAYLRDVWTQFHRVDGGMPWIDIRFDRIIYPADGARTASAGGTR
ncbi:cell division protein FtsQ/DivIB [Fontivita pretiosa]|uniref:cell division protein FtsQ/DivIB n=1 Tax=Fontivita pretiosa TaxID=2989684 RepID=UPI003D175EEE